MPLDLGGLARNSWKDISVEHLVLSQFVSLEG